MMTRKDYMAVSDILAEYAPHTAEPMLFDQMVKDFADYMADDNPRFLHDKFVDACYSKVAVPS
jgi:hypothetical protein